MGIHSMICKVILFLVILSRLKYWASSTHFDGAGPLSFFTGSSGNAQGAVGS
jgi:hypothetical protein